MYTHVTIQFHSSIIEFVVVIGSSTNIFVILFSSSFLLRCFGSRDNTRFSANKRTIKIKIFASLSSVVVLLVRLTVYVNLF